MRISILMMLGFALSALLFPKTVIAENILLAPDGSSVQAVAANQPATGSIWAGVAQSFVAQRAQIGVTFFANASDSISALYLVSIYEGDGVFSSTPVAEEPIAFESDGPVTEARLSINFPTLVLIPGEVYTVVFSLPDKALPPPGTQDPLSLSYGGNNNPYAGGRFWFFGANYDQSLASIADRDLAFTVTAPISLVGIPLQPVYLTPVISNAGVTFDTDGLVARPGNAQTYRFEPGATGTRVRFGPSGVVRDRFNYAVSVGLDGRGTVELSFTDGVSGVTNRLITLPPTLTTTDPEYTLLRDTWGQDTADLFVAVDISMLVPALQLEVQSRIEGIAIQFRGDQWDIETNTTETLFIPDQVFNAAPPALQLDQTPTSPVATQSDVFLARQYDGDLLSTYTPDDFAGAWALPMYLTEAASVSALSGARPGYFQEKIVFAANGTATGDYSGRSFDWVLADNTLTLTAADESFEYALLSENLGVGLFSLTYSSDSDPEGFQIAALGGQFQPSGVERAQSFNLTLPQYYQTLLFGEPELIDGVLPCPQISGWIFVGDALAQQILTCAEGTDDFIFRPRSSIEVSGDEIELVYTTPTFSQRRFLQLLSETDEGLVIAAERFGFATDITGQGQFPSSAYIEAAAPRIIALKPFDLSLAGAPWEKLDIDDDGLTNSQEDLQGTSYIEPDTDGDMVRDDQDVCQGTAPGEVVDMTGCPASERDSDSDGFNDDVDFCADTAPGLPVNAVGCARPQLTADLDSDGDGIPDLGEVALGTSPDLADTDGDGASDLEELEAQTDPTDADDAPFPSGIDVFLIKAAIDRTRESPPE
jgi:hypothetical protein